MNVVSCAGVYKVYINLYACVMLSVVLLVMVVLYSLLYELNVIFLLILFVCVVGMACKQYMNRARNNRGKGSISLSMLLVTLSQVGHISLLWS